MINGEEIKKTDNACAMTTYARLPVVLTRGAGVHVFDADGKDYLDFLAGIAVNALGHCHPAVVKAISEQAGTLIHTSNLYYTAPQAMLAKKLVEISDFERAFFCNSGAEANEAAIKIARKHGKATGSDEKFTIITAERSFHGRTMATVTATAQEKYQKPFTPMLTGFRYVPFNDIAALTEAMDDTVCAVLLEPIQGEGGVYPATQAYLEEARKLCDQYDALLMFDEVQTGVGRTGKWFAYQHFNVIPDVMTLAKALGGGFPIGACLARGRAAATLIPGDHGSTFGGNPLACATAHAVLSTIEKENLCNHAEKTGAYFAKKAREVLGSYILEVRGSGLMIGIETAKPIAKQVVSDALKAGLILNATSDTTLRLLPPLIVTEKDVDQALSVLKTVFDALTKD